MDKKKLTFVLNSIYVLIIGAIAYFSVVYAFKYAAPFIIGFILAAMFQPLIHLIQRKTRLPIKLIAIVVILAFFAILGVLLGWGSFRVFVFLGNFFDGLPELYFLTIVPFLERMSNDFSQLVSQLDPSIVRSIEQYFNNFIGSTSTIITDISVSVVQAISSNATKVPMMFVSTLVTIIFTFFIAIDYDKITTFIKNQLSVKVKETIEDLNGFLVSILKKYGKSYLIIVSITFAELALALSILGVNNALIIAFLIAIFDILPILGTGGIVIPWAIFVLIDGNIFLGVSLLVVYVIITVIRNIIEPRIVGYQVGLHPVITLLAMFVGVRIIGFFGLFIAPITLAILKSFHDANKIKLYKEPIEIKEIE